MVGENIGRLERVPLKDVWKHEAHGFTKWLESNPDVLGDAIDIPLANIERERIAGSFRVDLVAEDASGNPVIIENQLEKSDHDHLGKLLTYLAAIEAKAAVWIVADPRPEHVKAISWLNDSSSASFYLLKIEAVKIGDSPSAPMLTLIVGPSEESKSIGDTKKEIAVRHTLRRRFWTQLIEQLRERGIPLHANISPGDDPWLSTGAGKSGLSLSYGIRMTEAWVYLYIYRGKGADEETRQIFDELAAKKQQVENAYGATLEWSRADGGTRRCLISHVLDVGGLRQEDKWNQIQDAMIDAMSRFEKALRPYIEALNI